jgi:hypothetical protein
VVVLMVVALVDVLEWIVLTPIWSRCLDIGFNFLVPTPVLSHLLTCNFLNFKWEAWGMLG